MLSLSKSETHVIQSRHPPKMCSAQCGRFVKRHKKTETVQNPKPTKTHSAQKNIPRPASWQLFVYWFLVRLYTPSSETYFNPYSCSLKPPLSGWQKATSLSYRFPLWALHSSRCFQVGCMEPANLPKACSGKGGGLRVPEGPMVRHHSSPCILHDVQISPGLPNCGTLRQGANYFIFARCWVEHVFLVLMFRLTNQKGGAYRENRLWTKSKQSSPKVVDVAWPVLRCYLAVCF